MFIAIRLSAQAFLDEFDFEKVYSEGVQAIVTDEKKALECLQLIELNKDHLTPLQKARADYYLRLKLISSNVDSVKALNFKMFSAPDSLGIADSLVFTARRYLLKSMPDKAIPMLMQAIDSVHKGSDKADFCIINLCEAYRQKQEYQKGIEMLNELLFREKSLSDENRAFAYNRIAALYHESGSRKTGYLDSVVLYSNKCIALSEKIKSIPNLAAAQNELGFQYVLKKEYKKASELSKKAIGNFITAGLPYNAMNVLINLSNIFIGLNQYDSALIAVDSATRLCKIEENRNLYMRLYLQFASINESLGNYKDAYDFLNISQQLQRDFFRDRIDMQINEQSAKYDLLVKEQKLKDEKQKNEFIRKQFIFLVIIVVVLIIAFIITFYYLKLRRKDFLKKRLLDAVVETETTERKRIARDLHDGLGPVISAINHYFQAYIDSGEEEKEKIRKKLQQVIMDAIDEVSRISHNISPYVLERQGLNTALKNFFAPLIQGGKMNVDFTSDFHERFELKKELTIYRCITELINNTLKHAGANLITIKIANKGGILSVLYADNGKGFDPNAQKADGMGLFNIRNRVETLEGKISLTSSPVKGTIVQIELPV